MAENKQLYYISSVFPENRVIIGHIKNSVDTYLVESVGIKQVQKPCHIVTYRVQTVEFYLDKVARRRVDRQENIAARENSYLRSVLKHRVIATNAGIISCEHGSENDDRLLVVVHVGDLYVFAQFRRCYVEAADNGLYRFI